MRQVCCFGKRSGLRLDVKESRFLSERKGKVIPCRGAEDGWEQAVESLHKGGIVLQWKVFIRGA